MKKHCLLILSFVLLGANQIQAQVITGFGSSQLNPVTPLTDVQAPWTVALTSQTTTNFTVSGEPAFGGGGFVTTMTTPVTIYDQSLTTLKLVLTGELTAATPANPFTVTLYDTSGSFNSLTFTYNWSSFSQSGVTTVAASNPVESGAFNWQVGTFGINVGGAPTDTISFQFDDLIAVPEPSTYAMFGFGLFMLYFVYRRKVCQVVRA